MIYFDNNMAIKYNSLETKHIIKTNLKISEDSKTFKISLMNRQKERQN